MPKASDFRLSFFVLLLGAILYLALAPIRYGDFLTFLPMKTRRWLCEHDDINNIAAFFVLASITFQIGRKFAIAPGPGISGRIRGVLARREVCLAALMVLVCVLELSQLVIPGRMSGLRDVCTGWSGLFAAWLLAAVLGWHGTGD